jgi:RNA-directed DNA polymerase
VIVKSYDLRRSPPYRVSSKRRLAEELGVVLKTLMRTARSEDGYRQFSSDKNGEVRRLSGPIGSRRVVHRRLFVLLRRIAPLNYLHSGVKRRSFRSNAERYVKDVQLFKLDVRDFFTSVTKTQLVHALIFLFEMVPDAAHLLADVSCYQKHLPTGSLSRQLLAY